METITKSAGETKKLAADFAKELKPGDLVCLYGDLGAGKTTFAQGLARGLGVKKRVLSPTFVFVRIYQLDVAATHGSPEFEAGSVAARAGHAPQLQEGNKSLKLVHIDLYRVEKSEDADSLGLEEFWSDPKNIVLIEWAERVRDLLPEKRIDVKFEYVSENERRIELLS